MSLTEAILGCYSITESINASEVGLPRRYRGDTANAISADRICCGLLSQMGDADERQDTQILDNRRALARGLLRWKDAVASTSIRSGGGPWCERLRDRIRFDIGDRAISVLLCGEQRWQGRNRHVWWQARLCPRTIPGRGTAETHSTWQAQRRSFGPDQQLSRCLKKKNATDSDGGAEPSS